MYGIVAGGGQAKSWWVGKVDRGCLHAIPEVFGKGIKGKWLDFCVEEDARKQSGISQMKVSQHS